MDKEELAYLAGFFDGEGCVYMRKFPQSGRYAVKIACAQNVRAPLDALAAAFGGNVRGPLKYGKNTQTHYRWEVESKIAEAALRAMRPFLRVKHEVADVVLAYRDTVRQHKGGCDTLPNGLIAERDALYAQLRNLNRRETLNK